MIFCYEFLLLNDAFCFYSENIEQKSAPVLDATENLVNVSLDLERKINTVSVDNPKNVGDNFVNKNGTTGKRYQSIRYCLLVLSIIYYKFKKIF